MLVEAVTYRFRGHSMADPEEYRTKEEVAHWRERDPIPAFGDAARARGDPGAQGRERTRRGRRSRRVDAAVAVRGGLAVPARRSRCTTTSTCSTSRCAARTRLGSVAAAAARAVGLAAGAAAWREIPRQLTDGVASQPRTRRERDALPRGAERGAARGAGARRARDADGRGHRRVRRRVQGDRRACSRSSASGACATRRSRRTRSSASGVGAAMTGLRPVVELMTINFALLAFDQIVNTPRTSTTCSAAR